MPSREESLSHSYISGIDGLRAVAVVAVIVYHLKSKLLAGGFAGVDVFFVISGYVVTTSIMDRKFASFSELVLHFYSRRFLRIVPALTIMLFVASIATIALVPAGWLSDSNRNTALSAFFGFSNVRLARNADDYFGPRTDYNPFAHTWSLGVEEQFYLLFPLMVGTAALLRTHKNVGLFLALGLAVASFATAAFFTSRAPLFSFFLLPSRFWELAAGLLIATTSHFWLGKMKALRVELLNYSGYGLLILLAVSFVFCEENHFPFPWAIGPVFATAGLIMILSDRRDTTISIMLSMRGMTLVGLLSYSLYLWHWPIYVLFRWTIGLTTVLNQLTALLLTLLAAVASYFVVERPVRYSRSVASLSPIAVVLLFSFGALLIAVATRGAFHFSDRLSLSVTANHDTWSNTPILAAGCLSLWSDKNIAEAYPNTNCPLANGRQLLVAGDSHAGAYSRMLARYSDDHATPITIYSKPGCPFLSFRVPTRLLQSDCLVFNRDIRDDMVNRSGSLTTVFLPSLRIDRFQDQWGGVNPPLPSVNDEAVEEARTFIAELSGRGAIVILEAPTPVFWSPPFRCADWFNKMNPICSHGFVTDMAVLEARRTAIVNVEHALAASIRRVIVWDPVSTLCDPNFCSAFQDARPLFYDGDHLSGYGNDVLYSSFSNQLLESEKIASHVTP